MPELEQVPAQVATWRSEYYNATVVAALHCGPGLLVLRVRPDAGAKSFAAGQYTTLGLGEWEPDVPVEQPQLAVPFKVAESAKPKLIRRAYSFAATLADANGQLVPLSACDYWEFYIALAASADEDRPLLTPKLFALQPGDRLQAGPKCAGKYTLAGIPADHQVVLIGTGTGEAPHLAMAAEWLAHGNPGRLTVLTCARFRADLPYETAHRQLEAQFPQYRYLAYTTREPENTDPTRPDFVGKRYVQHLLVSGELEAQLGHPLDPRTTHLFLCGNPAMIGGVAPLPGGVIHSAEQMGMSKLLQGRGFTLHDAKHVGNLHVEKYW